MQERHNILNRGRLRSERLDAGYRGRMAPVSTFTRGVDDRGSTIVFVVIIGAVFALMAAGTISLAIQGAQFGKQEELIVMSRWANESAINICGEIVLRAVSVPDLSARPLFTGADSLRVNGLVPKISVDSLSADAGDFEASTALAGVGTVSDSVRLSFTFTTPDSISGHRWLSVLR